MKRLSFIAASLFLVVMVAGIAGSNQQIDTEKDIRAEWEGIAWGASLEDVQAVSGGLGDRVGDGRPGEAAYLTGKVRRLGGQAFSVSYSFYAGRFAGVCLRSLGTCELEPLRTAMEDWFAKKTGVDRWASHPLQAALTETEGQTAIVILNAEVVRQAMVRTQLGRSDRVKKDLVDTKSRLEGRVRRQLDQSKAEAKQLLAQLANPVLDGAEVKRLQGRLTEVSARIDKAREFLSKHGGTPARAP